MSNLAAVKRISFALLALFETRIHWEGAPNSHIFLPLSGAAWHSRYTQRAFVIVYIHIPGSWCSLGCSAPYCTSWKGEKKTSDLLWGYWTRGTKGATVCVNPGNFLKYTHIYSITNTMTILQILGSRIFNCIEKRGCCWFTLPVRPMIGFFLFATSRIRIIDIWYMLLADLYCEHKRGSIK